VIGSFILEASGSVRASHLVRFTAALAYIYFEMPLHCAPHSGNALGLCIRLSLLCVLGGFLTVSFFPGYRVSLLHLTLVGGFAVLMFVVATRVVFGHSGNSRRLKSRNRWLIVAVSLMLLGMATRMSGDFWPKLRVSHYGYGAILWISGVLVWAAYVLPNVLVADSDD
jgi:uncharacterized protein involved in response to NO